MRSGAFFVDNNDNDTTDHFTPCAYARDNKNEVTIFIELTLRGRAREEQVSKTK